MSTPCDVTPVRTPGGWRVLAPFRFREFRLLIAAMSISLFAEGMDRGDGPSGHRAGR